MSIILQGGDFLDYISFEKEALFEQRFWLQILGDHARFIYNTLSSSEKEKIEKAIYFIRIFDELLEEARMSLDGRQVYELMLKSQHHSKDIREFKLELIKEHLVGNIIIGLSPTFVNHMVNEVEEYLRILQCLISDKIPTAHPIHYHKLWLPDASGHADAVKCELDSVETELREKSQKFVVEFNNLFIKANEFSGYLRTCVQDFPALHRLNYQAEYKIQLFMEFLKEIEELRLSKEAVGTFMPLMVDHMLREECYYITKLSKVSKVDMPDCDPTKPRVKD